MPITKRPCANCPFRSDGAGIKLEPGRVEGIVAGLKADDQQTFVCHKTLDKERMTCVGAVALMSKVGRLPVIARLGLAVGVITKEDIAASAAMVIDPGDFTQLVDNGEKSNEGIHMAGDIVITWDNQGVRTEHAVSGQKAGVMLARTFRTVEFRTVKVADALGSTHHWSRSTGLGRNHWSVRRVADIACS